MKPHAVGKWQLNEAQVANLAPVVLAWRALARARARVLLSRFLGGGGAHRRARRRRGVADLPRARGGRVRRQVGGVHALIREELKIPNMLAFLAFWSPPSHSVVSSVSACDACGTPVCKCAPPNRSLPSLQLPGAAARCNRPRARRAAKHPSRGRHVAGHPYGKHAFSQRARGALWACYIVCTLGHPFPRTANAHPERPWAQLLVAARPFNPLSAFFGSSMGAQVPVAMAAALGDAEGSNPELMVNSTARDAERKREREMERETAKKRVDERE